LHCHGTTHRQFLFRHDSSAPDRERAAGRLHSKPMTSVARRYAPAVAFALYLALAVVATYPLVLRAADHVFGLGTPPLNVWALGVVLHQLPREPWNLFDGNAFYPHAHSLAFSEHLFVPALLAAPVVWLTGNLVLAHNVVALLSLALAGLGMFLLARELTADVAAALAAGALYAFHTWNVNELIRLQILSNQWFPFLLLFLLRFFDAPSTRRAVQAAAFFLLQALSCMYWALYAPLLVGAVCLFEQHRRRLTLSQLRPLVTAFGGALLLLAPFLVPYVVTSREMGFQRSPPAALAVDRYFDVRPGNWLYEGWLGIAGPNENAPHFLGFAALALGLLGVLKAGEALRRRRALLLGMLAAGFLLSLGPELRLGEWSFGPGPYALLRAFVPGFTHVRYPERFAVFVALALAPFVAAGVAWLRARLGRAVVVAAGAAIFVEHLSAPLELVPLPPPSEAHRFLADSDAGVVAEVPVSRYRMERHDAQPMYHSTAHWKRTLVGFTGYFPPTTNFIRWRLFHFPDAASVTFLRRLGVDTLIVAPDAEGRPQPWAGRDARWTLLRRFASGHSILRLPVADEMPISSPPAPARPLRKLDRNAWDVQASEPGAALALDGDPATAWTTGQRRQGKGDFYRITFAQPATVARVSVGVAPAFEFPMHLKLMGRVEGGWVRLPLDEPAAYDALFASLLHAPRRATLDLDIEPRRVSALRLRITTTDAFWMPWTLPEVNVYVSAALDATPQERR